jgi:hypothetical protein
MKRIVLFIVIVTLLAPAVFFASPVSRRATYAGQVPTPGQCGCSTKVGVVLLPV